MGVTNNERIHKVLDSLKHGLCPYVEQKMKAVYKDKWKIEVESFLRAEQRERQEAGDILCENWKDVAILLKVIDGKWNEVFRDKSSKSDRSNPSFVNELIDIRHKWAHQKPFLTDDTFRAIDSVTRLLRFISAPEAEEVEKERQEVLRLLFFEQVVSNLATIKDLIPPSQDDVKGWLQQLVLAPAFNSNPSRQPPEYTTERSGGTDNSPEFTAVVYVAGVEYGRGIDRNKKDAEKRAAEDALRKLGLL